MARPGRRTWLWLGALLVLGTGVRALLPVGLAWYVNRTLDRTEGYRGRVGDVDLALWRGAYRIEDVALEDAGGDVPMPIFRGDAVDLSLQWGALLHGELVGEVVFTRPRVNLVAGPDEARTQMGTEPHWSERLGALLPVRINHLAVRDGALRFRDPWSEPEVDVGLTDLEIEARNLTNVRERSKQNPAHVHATATAFDSGTLDLVLDLDPLAHPPTFRLKGRVEDVDLTRLNDFFRAYGGFDAERGRLVLVSEVECEDGRYRGYLKPLVRDLDVLRIGREGEEQGPLDTIWEALFGGAAEALENQLQDQQGARIPIEGRFERPDIGLWAALESLLRNAFSEALEPRFERIAGRGGA